MFHLNAALPSATRIAVSPDPYNPHTSTFIAARVLAVTVAETIGAVITDDVTDADVLVFATTAEPLDTAGIATAAAARTPGHGQHSPVVIPLVLAAERTAGLIADGIVRRILADASVPLAPSLVLTKNQLVDIEDISAAWSDVIADELALTDLSRTLAATA